MNNYNQQFKYNFPMYNQNNRYIPQYNPYIQMFMPYMSLYDYNNNDETEKDIEYFKSICPNSVKKIIKQVDEECDKLEYDGSCMFDEYPDKIQLGIIINRIYDKLKDLEEIGIEIDNINKNEDIVIQQTCRGGNCPPPPRPDCRGGNCPPPPRPDCKGGNCPPPRPYPNQNNWLINLIETTLYNEMSNRRRRYRNKKRWF